MEGSFAHHTHLLGVTSPNYIKEGPANHKHNSANGCFFREILPVRGDHLPFSTISCLIA
jgi:hypothetical protein